MKNITKSIIPSEQTFYKLNSKEVVDWETNSKNSLDLHAISTFCSLGFMLDDETYYKEIKTCKPMTKYNLN